METLTPVDVAFLHEASSIQMRYHDKREPVVTSLYLGRQSKSPVKRVVKMRTKSNSAANKAKELSFQNDARRTAAMKAGQVATYERSTSALEQRILAMEISSMYHRSPPPPPSLDTVSLLANQLERPEPGSSTPVSGVERVMWTDPSSPLSSQVKKMSPASWTSRKSLSMRDFMKNPPTIRSPPGLSRKSLSALDFRKVGKGNVDCLTPTSFPGGILISRTTKVKSLSAFNIFGTKKESEEIPTIPTKVDLMDNIGLRLALPSAIAIMTGKQPAPRPGSSRATEAADHELSHLSVDTRDDFNAGSAFQSSDDYILRTCEIEPSKHQLAIPPAEELLMNGRICSSMGGHSKFHSRGEWARAFGLLAGLTRSELEKLYESAVAARDGNGINKSDKKLCVPAMENISAKSKFDLAVQSEVPPSLLKSLLECGHDLVLENYFHETFPRKSSNLNEVDSMEVAIFSSERYRQFIVFYRGSLERQKAPVDVVKSGWLKDSNSDRMTLLHNDYPLPVHPTFSACYFACNIEKKVFSCLDRLLAKNPFCDLVTTGNSFGGALATLGAVRFAALYPMITTSCHAFGAPKVGGVTFRQFTNSLPNLKIVRIENGLDPFVSQPEGPMWVHVGHTITLNEESSNLSTSPTELSPPSRKCTALAYRFDEKRSASKPLLSTISDAVVGKNTRQMKSDQEIRNYVHSLEKFTHLGHPWVSNFVGEEGNGITGMNDEERCVV